MNPSVTHRTHIAWYLGRLEQRALPMRNKDKTKMRNFHSLGQGGGKGGGGKEPGG